MNQKGNPHIGEISKTHSTGPKTEIGKIKSSMNLNNSAIDKMINDTHLDFGDLEESLKKRNAFELWLASKGGKELDYIATMDRIIRPLDAKVTMKIMEKIERKKDLNKDDVMIIRNLMDAIAMAHKMKFGDKRVNLHASYNDIREMMMGKKEKNDNP